MLNLSLVDMLGFKFSVWTIAFFFFSSRRRHTRLQGDWSSDVCSSDLLRFDTPGAGQDVMVGGRVRALREALRRRPPPATRAWWRRYRGPGARSSFGR